MKLLCPLIRFVALGFAIAPSLPALAADLPKKLLVVTVTTGFRHSSIPVAEKIIAQLAKESGKFTVDFVQQPEGQPKAPTRPRPGQKGADDPAHQTALRKFAEDERIYHATWGPKIAATLEKLSPANLRNYHAVLVASTSGDDVPLPTSRVSWTGSRRARRSLACMPRRIRCGHSHLMST
jgi:hypothetical protein